MAGQLDRSRHHAQVYNDPEGRHYEQDGQFYTASGAAWNPRPAPADPEPAPPPAPRRKPAPAQLDAQLADPPGEQP